jgi:hypothetical protein
LPIETPSASPVAGHTGTLFNRRIIMFPNEQQAFDELKKQVDNIERVLRMDALTAVKLDHPEGRSVNGIFSVPATANS